MGKRVLIADDSITIQKVVAIIFANEGYELTIVDNGVAALEKAREVHPDVMLVDALMPGKTGYEVCAEIRRDPKLCSVPILLMIGAFENPDEEEGRSCGADASISKPFESQQLIDQVKELLELGASPLAAPARESVLAEGEALWGDLSSFDTLPPAVEPAPPFATGVPPEPAAARHAAPAAGAPAQFEEEIIEASLEDDLWGAFELEEEPQLVVRAQSPTFARPEAEPEQELEAEEVFGLEESDEVEETGPPLAEVAEAEEPVVLQSDEELFSFSEDLTFKTPPNMEPFDLPEYEPLTFEPAPPAEASPAELDELEEFGPISASDAAGESERLGGTEPIPVLEPQSAPVVEAAPEGGEAPAGRVLSESELVAAISRVSREVIERVVWEVVPDLAEALIKEEIRKLKAGIRG